MNVVGYLRVSTREQAEDGHGLDAQRSMITAEAERRGWKVTWCIDEGLTGLNDNRPGLKAALRLVRRHKADALVVAKLDRLSRSMQDFARMLNTSKRQRWALIALDLNVDMTSPEGRLVAHILAAVAEWESARIGQRTRDGMAEAKLAKGHTYGRTSVVPPEVVARIVAEREAGTTLAAIAAALDADDVAPPGAGQRWYASTVGRLIAAQGRAREAVTA